MGEDDRRTGDGIDADGAGSADPGGGTVLSPAARRLLGALLHLDAERAAAVRARAARPRPRRMTGPSADLGD